MNAPEARPAPPRIPASTLVLAERTLRPDAVLEDTARFSDMVWPLAPAQRQQHRKQVSIDFTHVPERFRTTAKQVAYALLSADRPPGCENIRSIDTVNNLAFQLCGVLRWIDDRGLGSVSATTHDDVIAFQRHVDGLRLTEGSKAHLPRALRLLWLCRAHLDDPLTFDPAAAFGTRPRITAYGRENETARIPEQVHAPCLVWAMRWVDDFAPDILRAGAEWNSLQKPLTPPGHRRGSHVDTPARVAAVSRVIARYRRERRALPGYQGTVNLSHLRREAHVARTSVQPTRPAGAVINEAVNELGVDDDTYLWAPIDVLLDGQPWRGRIRYAEVEELYRMLYIACYIVIIYLSGMRDSEVKHLQRGCISVWRAGIGSPARWQASAIRRCSAAALSFWRARKSRLMCSAITSSTSARTRESPRPPAGEGTNRSVTAPPPLRSLLSSTHTWRCDTPNCCAASSATAVPIERSFISLLSTANRARACSHRSTDAVKTPASTTSNLSASIAASEHPNLGDRLCSPLLHSECQKTTAIGYRTPGEREAHF